MKRIVTLPFVPVGAAPLGHTIYNGVGHTVYNGVGADAVATPAKESDGIDLQIGHRPTTTLGKILTWGAIGAAAFHGYKRNQSIKWAVGWAVGAAISPVIAGGVAIAQGFGKRKGS